ncbi:MAG: YecA family protein [Gammaproteobacteria bacterium]|nr:YecA family protein [Gammaproteobacteria bacterium]
MPEINLTDTNLIDNLTYDLIDDALIKANAIADASEAQGTLCGMICVSGKGDLNNWLSHIFGEEKDSANLYVPESDKVLTALHDSTVKELTENNYDLKLILHDDSESLDIRIEDLSNWCQGFLYGLSAAGLKDIKKLPEEASEILQDMLDISKAGYDPEADEEENEEAYAEIVEYIRIGVYVVFDTLNSTENTSTTIH